MGQRERPSAEIYSEEKERKMNLLPTESSLQMRDYVCVGGIVFFLTKTHINHGQRAAKSNFNQQSITKGARGETAVHY